MGSGLSHGPNSPLRSTRSNGLTMDRSGGGAWPPQVDWRLCGPANS
nr:hypothetical protein CPGR_05739 [Mycolicibacter nonchromogenicus]